MFPNASGVAIRRGTFIQTSRTSRGVSSPTLCDDLQFVYWLRIRLWMDLFMEWITTGAFYTLMNSMMSHSAIPDLKQPSLKDMCHSISLWECSIVSRCWSRVTTVSPISTTGCNFKLLIRSAYIIVVQVYCQTLLNALSNKLFNKGCLPVAVSPRSPGWR